MIRKKPAFLLPILTITLIAMLMSQCGGSKSDDDDKNEAPTELPSDWDGTSDWSGSALKVVDE